MNDRYDDLHEFARRSPGVHENFSSARENTSSMSGQSILTFSAPRAVFDGHYGPQTNLDVDFGDRCKMDAAPAQRSRASCGLRHARRAGA